VLSGYEKIESVRLLEQRSVITKNSSRDIKNVSAHILPIKRTISTKRGVGDIDVERYQELRVLKDIKGSSDIPRFTPYHSCLSILTKVLC
jgi:two-component system, sensor histidine kinase YesM